MTPQHPAKCLEKHPKYKAAEKTGEWEVKE
jgi:hypothetical protein